jgi:hypothetical protein
MISDERGLSIPVIAFKIKRNASAFMIYENFSLQSS